MDKHVAAPRGIAKSGVAQPHGRMPPDGALAGQAPGSGEAALAALFAPARGLSGVGPYLDGALARLFGLADGVAARRLDLLWHLPQASA